MNDPFQMMGHSQILPSHQNYVVWPQPPPFNNPHPGRVNWRHEKRRRIGSGPGQCSTNPRDSQRYAHNHKRRRFHHSNRRHHGGGSRRRLSAPRNTTSYIIRAKRSGGITSLVSPSLPPTPVMTPTRENLCWIEKDEWGMSIDLYGTMKGRIRLRRDSDEESEVISGGSEDSDKELDYDLSRFEMIYPDELNLENRVSQKGKRIADLVEENFELNERIFLLEWELVELRKRVLRLELETDGNGSEPEVINDGDFCLSVAKTDSNTATELCLSKN